MSFCLILLAAGESKRFNSKIPKPYIKMGEKTLLDHSLIKFNKIHQIKNIIIVVNKKHGKYLKRLKLKNVFKINGGKTRQESTYKALNYILHKKIKCKNVLIHDAARPNFSIKLIKKILKLSRKNSVIPKMPIQDALKETLNKTILLNHSRDDFFYTQTPYICIQFILFFYFWITVIAN